MAQTHSYSLRLVRPFLEVLARERGVGTRALARLAARDPDDRVPVASAHRWLERAIALTGDQALGLKAGAAMCGGDAGGIEFAASSAPTVREALAVVARYMHLLNDALEPRLELEGERACFALESQVVMSDVSQDFLVAAMYHSFGSVLRAAPGLECWLLRSAPADLRAHQAALAPAAVRFAAPFCGFAMPRPSLEVPLSSANPNLHSVLRKHVERMLTDIPERWSTSERVRRLLTEELARGDPSTAQIARRLHMSPRTLARKLEAEATTFSALLDDLRRRLALRHLGNPELGPSEVAFMLGFSHTPAFYRAFRRWTGQTPIEYRRKLAANG